MSIQPGNRMRGRALASPGHRLELVGVVSGLGGALQAASAPAPGSRVSGTVTAIAGNVLTVKTIKGPSPK